MTIVYLILCHKNPEQVVRLINRLDDGRAFFVVHVDKRAEERVYNCISRYASNVSNVYFCKRHRCFWGGFGIVRATINCIHTALELARPFDYAILLSGQDYPIKSNSEIGSFFVKNRGKEFIESFSLLKTNRWSDQGGMFNAINRVQYWTIFVRSRTLHIKWKRKFPFGWQPFGGSQWWCLSRETIEYLAAFLRSNSGFVRYFKTTFIPDESFFQSIISNSPYSEKIVRDDMRYTDWETPNPNYPRTLEESDFDKLKASHKLFARKLETVRSDKLLDRIDRDLLSFG
jgi:Core-2/I-Branching enzyme